MLICRLVEMLIVHSAAAIASIRVIAVSRWTGLPNRCHGSDDMQ
jgi:hypothetical protein